MTTATAYFEYVFHHTQTICFKEAFWYIYVYEGTHSLFENYVEKNEKDIGKLENILYQPK